MIRQRCSCSFPGLFSAEKLDRGVRTMAARQRGNVANITCVVFEHLFCVLGEKKLPSFSIQIKGSSANSPERLTAHFAACEHSEKLPSLLLI